MLSRRLSWYWLKSWKSTLIRRRNSGSDQFSRSTSSSRIRPSLGRYSRASSLTKVVLPAPFWPTMAKLSPGRMCKESPRSAQASLPGYWKPTFSKRSPLAVAGSAGDAADSPWPAEGASAR
jgi:hypothetical protein